MELVRLGQYEILVGGLAMIKESHKEEGRSRYIVDHQDIDGAFVIRDACTVGVPSVTQKAMYYRDRTFAYEGYEVLVLLCQYNRAGLTQGWWPARYVEGLFQEEQYIRPTNIQKVKRSW
jgi:hypothetical protein